MRQRIEDDRGDSEFDALTREKFFRYVKDLKLWGFALCFMASTTPSYAIAFFLPAILRGMNFSVRDSQLLVSVLGLYDSVSDSDAASLYRAHHRMWLA